MTLSSRPRIPKYLDEWVHVSEVLFILCKNIVSVDLQHELSVEVLPLLRWVNNVSIDSLPWFVI